MTHFEILHIQGKHELILGRQYLEPNLQIIWLLVSQHWQYSSSIVQK